MKNSYNTQLNYQNTINKSNTILKASKNAFQSNSKMQIAHNQTQKSQFLQDDGNKIEKTPRYIFEQQPQKRNTIDSKKIQKIPESTKTTINQKLKTLNRVRYINQLAQLDYEEKATQLYTKHSRVSKQTLMKKIKAKNQMADFIQEQDQFLDDFEELKDYKYGKSKQYHFEHQEQRDYLFCDKCDLIHNDYPEVHSNICKNYSNSQQKYWKESLERIKQSLKKLNSQQAQQLYCIIGRIMKKQRSSLDALKEVYEINQNDKVLSQICLKIYGLAQK